MRFTSHNCYQLRGSLLHCLFTLTLCRAVCFLLHFLSDSGIYSKNCICLSLPGYYPAFFPMEPGLSSCLHTVISMQTRDQILFVIILIIQNRQILPNHHHRDLQTCHRLIQIHRTDRYLRLRQIHHRQSRRQDLQGFRHH